MPTDLQTAVALSAVLLNFPSFINELFILQATFLSLLCYIAHVLLQNYWYFHLSYSLIWSLSMSVCLKQNLHYLNCPCIEGKTLRLGYLAGWVWACFIYSRDGTTGVRGEQWCAFSFPLEFGFLCLKEQNRKRAQMPLCRMGGVKGRKARGLVPFPSIHHSVSTGKSVKIDFCCVNLSPLRIWKSNSTYTFQ